MLKRLFYTFALLFSFGAHATSAAATLTNVKDSLSTYASGAMALHIITFTTPATISYAGSFEVVFPDSTTPAEPKFGLVNGQIIAAFGPIVTNPVDATRSGGGISQVVISGNKVRCYRDGKGTDLYVNTKITLLLALVRNPLSSRQDVVITLNYYDGGSNTVEHSGTSINYPYHIDGPAKSFSFASIGTQLAGQPFTLQVFGAKDEFGHGAGGTVTVTALSGGGAAPDGTLPALNSIALSNGSGQASQVLYKAETGVVLQGTTAATTLATNSFTVSPGVAGRLSIRGEPLAITANETFPGALTVEAFDKYNNLATNYAKTDSFFNNDPLKQAGDLPNPSSLSSGQKSFPGGSFRLRTAGARRIWVSDGTLADTTGIINVSGGAIASYNLNVAGSPVAGQSATISVTNAVDAAGNPASGTVTLSFTDGNPHNIGAYTPSLPILTVLNGIGSGTAIFYKAEEAVSLKGLVGTAQDTSNTFRVQPGPLGALLLAPDPATLPATVTAGSALGGAMDYFTVTVRDGYGNVKADFTGNIAFSSSDARAEMAAPYTFQTSDQGSKRFNRSQFKLRTAGSQIFSVQSGGYTASVGPIQVRSDVITGFVLSAGASQTAGVPFTVTASGAVDQFGNPADGLVAMRAGTGGSAAPNGQSPTLVSIPVSNGSGQAAQILVKTENATLIGEVKSGGTVLAADTTAVITIKPGALGYLELLGLPTSIPADSTFPGRVTVTAYDSYRNSKTDYSGTIHFNLSNGVIGALPPDKTFEGAQASFEQIFRIQTPGPQTITVSDVHTGINTTSAAIDVSALVIKRISSIYSQVNKGQANIPVIMEVWNYGSEQVTDIIASLQFSPNSGDYSGSGPISSLNIPAFAGGNPGTRQISFSVAVSPDAALGSTTVSGAVSGSYKGSPVSVTGAETTHSWTVREQASMEIVEIFPSRPAVSLGQSVPWEVMVSVHNTGSFPVTINFDPAKTNLQFRQGGSTSSGFTLISPSGFLPEGVNTTLEGGATRQMKFIITGVSAPAGTYAMVSQVETTDGLKASAFGSIEVQSPPDLVALTNSVQPSYVSGGRGYSFQLIVTNMGGATLELNPDQTVFSFTDGTTTYSSALDSSFGTTLPGGSSTRTFHFQFKTLSSAVAAGRYPPRLVLAGTQNGNPFSYTLASLSNNLITVAAPREVMITLLKSEATTVTAGQSKPWFIAMEVTNNGNSILQLDSTRLVFYRNNTEVSASFAVVNPGTFVTGSSELTAITSNTIRYRVDAVDANLDPGPITISGHVWLTDKAVASRRFDEQTDQANSGSVAIEEPAEPVVLAFLPSQSSVTRGQTAPWTVFAKMSNRGGSTVALRADQLQLNFSSGNDFFTIQPPAAFSGSGDTLLAPGAEDSLLWTVTNVSAQPSLPETVRVNGQLSLTELNSDRLILIDTSLGNLGFDIAIQDSASARLAGLRVAVPQDSMVNGGQSFYVHACVKSAAGRDALNRTRIRLDADGYLSFPSGHEVEVGPIPSGDSLWTEPGILVKADSVAGVRPALFARIIVAEARNTMQPTLIAPVLSPPDSAKTIYIQKAGAMAVTRMFTSQDTIPSGYSLDWTIQVSVTNLHEGALVLDPPQPGDITMKQGFVIRAPELTLAQRTLSAGDTLHVVYEVIASSSGSGQLPIIAHLTAKDANDTLRSVSATASTAIFVSTSARTRIVRTAINPETYYVDTNGIGHVNTRQMFIIEVDVENSGGQPLKRVEIQLSSKKSKISSAIQAVENLSTFEGARRLLFAVQADSLENLTGELFTAKITQATGEDGSAAFIAAPTDAAATIYIYRPAVLKLISTSALTPNSERIVSYGQPFPVEVVVQNLGSEPVSGVMVSLSVEPAEGVKIAETPLLLAKTILAGDTCKAVFAVTADTLSGQVVMESDIIASFGQNIKGLVPLELSGQDSSSIVTVESAAKLEIVSVTAPPAVTAGDAQNNWRIYVVVANRGDADLRFIDLSPDNIRFYTNGMLDDGYRVNAPAKLLGSDSLVLKGQSQDSLLYIVTRNGDFAGMAELRVQLNASDLNRAVTGTPPLIAAGSTTFEVSSTSWVRINQTEVVSANQYDELGVALLNRGSTFKIEVEAETSELTGVDSVWIQITGEGGSSIVEALRVIPAIGKGSTGRAEFTLIADEGWARALGEKRETFAAKIISAKAVGSALAAQIRPPERSLDAITAVRIQNPARLDLRLQRDSGQDSILTAGQEFTLLVNLANLGTAAMRSGQYRLILPAGNSYQLAKGAMERSFDVPLGRSSFTDTLVLVAPNFDSFSDTIRVQLSQVPQDVNNSQPAEVERTLSGTVVTTLKSGLSLNFAIHSPSGAQDRILSTAQQIVLRAIVQATQNIHDKRVALQMPVTPAYVLLSDAEQAVISNRDTIFWRIQVPAEETLLAHNFLAQARGRSADGVETIQRTVTIDQIVTRASLWLDDLEVSSPTDGVMEGGQANFSIRQQATLRTRVRNLGAARIGTTGKLKLSLQNSGLTLMGSDSVKSFTAGTYVTWNVQAAESVISEIRDIRVDISTIPSDENTNAAASITNGTVSLNVLTEARGFARIDKLFISNPLGAMDNSVSALQSFVVTAEITSNRVRNLQAEISFTGAFTTVTPSVPVNEGTRQVVTWTMTAPPDASVNTLTLTVSARDYRSNLALTNQVRTLMVSTQPITRFKLTPKITYPAGLTNKISSEAPFKLSLYIQHQTGTAPYAESDAATIRLNAPPQFLDGMEPLIKTGLDSLEWNLIAPAVGQDTLFDVNFTAAVLPRDANSGLEAATDFVNVYFPVWVVRKTRLEILAHVQGQAGVSPITVRIGNEFNLVSVLHNLGSADYYGSYEVQLRLPAGYTTTQPLTVTTEADTVNWRIKLPDRVSDAPDTLVVKLLSAPKDFFTRTEAEIIRDSVKVLISPEAGFMVATAFPVKSGTVGLRGGANVAMLGLSLQNKDQSIGSRSLLDTLKISFRNKRGEAVPARSVISRLAAVRHGSPAEVLAENTSPGNSSHVFLNFAKAVPDTIRGSDLYTMDILVDIADNANLTDFMMAIDSAAAIIARDAIYLNRLSIADSALNRVQYLGFSSGILVVVQSVLEESFCNYPNPFGTPSRPTTKFVYYLKEASDVQIKIFTLTGDLVQAWEYTKATHPEQTSAGVHQDDVVWDGRNGRGEKVMNGVYLAYLKTEYGEMALAKIAVVK